ncbi:Ig-like domain-containing protein [Stigmatella sp. ncwal1]|uniref:Ig-like domain-containing protein n=1 Tax=Stigmatella ashevillensis TaxID=2995309 RepID=A0ABT5DGD0_9BACT|nr:Ig-like domain-containing protein [Stigmatella ashevillena]MDC0712725.1 Ig-like domain-containing protein [Stigmatella ashevillena]
MSDVTDGAAYELDLTAHRFMAVYLHGEIRLPVQLPSFLSFSRPSPGATNYSSSDESVARVDAQGMVTVLRNGQSTITALGTAGSDTHYMLTVKGIRGLEFLARQGSTWQNAVNLCASVGMQLPSQADFALLSSLYGAEFSGLGLPNYPIWGALIGADTAWSYHPHTRQLTAESTDSNTLRQVAGIG